jgi:predicted nucleic acid-binding protein
MTSPLPTSLHFVFDACALIAYFNDEIGSEKVEELFEQANRNEIDLYAASVNLYEVYYGALKRGSLDKAEELLKDLYSLPLTVVETLDQTLIRLAGHFKTAYRLSLADSVALALAKQFNAHLVSTDHHEFDVIEKSGEVQFFWLR